MSPRILEELDLEALPTGAVTQAWLNLTENGLGEPIRIPLLVARGERPGPVAGITAAVHGNEVNGVPVIHRLMQRLDLERLRGTVLGVPVVNTMGFLLEQRRTDDGMDLNHLFPGSPTGRESVVYAHRFFDKVVRQCNLLLDLHTASFGRVNSVYVRADMSDPAVARMAYLQRPQIVVHNPPADGTLRGAADALGIPAVTVELGNPARFQKEIVKRAVVGLRAVLAEWKMVPRRQVALGPPPILCESSSWMFTDQGGMLMLERGIGEEVAEGEQIANLRDVFGNPRAAYVAPHDGIVIGHSTNPVATTGARIVHLGRLTPPDSPLTPREDVP